MRRHTAPDPEETKNPQRNLPIGILGSLAIVTALCVAVSLVSTGMRPCTDIDPADGPRWPPPSPRWAPPWVGGIIAVGACIGLIVVAMILFLGQTRVGFAMARDGLLGVIVLRRTRPDLPRSFRVPFVPVVPILAVLICVYLMLNLTGATWIRFLVWMGIGFVVYVVYSRKHSVLARREAEALRRT